MTSTATATRKRRRGSQLASKVRTATLRRGGPAYITEPLLCLLYELDRIRVLVVDTLKEVGVSIPEESNEEAEGGREAVEEQASSLQSSPPLISPLRSYSSLLSLSHDDGEAPFASDRQVIESVLAWADQHSNSAVLSGNRALQELLFDGLAASDVTGDAKTQISESTRESPGLGSPGEATLGEEEVALIHQQCRSYERSLKASSRSIYECFQYLSRNPLVADPEVQVSDEKRKPPSPSTNCAAPCIAGATRNVAHRARLCELFASCHATMHSSLTSFSDSVEAFLSEAVAANHKESEYWSLLEKVELEYDALHEIIRRLQMMRRSTGRAGL